MIDSLWLLARVAALFLALGIVAPLVAQTGTFIDRWAPTDLRVVSYNIHLDDIFVDDNPSQAAKFVRVMQALQPDILALQEIYNHSAAQTANLMNSILPLGGGSTWYAYQSFDNVLVSKYPLSMTRGTTVPVPSATSYAMALVDLPDAQFDSDFYFMNSHFKCCSTQGTEESKRQEQADALVNWMRDARTPGGFVNLPTGTPMAVVGDLNVVQTPNPINTLLTGNIVNEGTYGSDSPPDWDGTALADAHPVHNGSGSTDWTYSSSGFSPTRLDYVLYTDSAVGTANTFLLNTVSMSAADRAATGLQQYDVTLTTSNYDHIPVVVDFRFPTPQPMAGDFNNDGTVDSADYVVLRKGMGSIYSQSDYIDWLDHFGQTSGSGGAASGFSSVPEPASYLLLLVSCAAAAVSRIRRGQPRHRR